VPGNLEEESLICKSLDFEDNASNVISQLQEEEEMKAFAKTEDLTSKEAQQSLEIVLKDNESFMQTTDDKVVSV